MPTIRGMTYTDLIKYYGSQSKVSRAIGIRPPSVWEWKKSGIPEKRQLQFQKMTDGALKADRAIVRRYRDLLSIRKAA